MSSPSSITFLPTLLCWRCVDTVVTEWLYPMPILTPWEKTLERGKYDWTWDPHHYERLSSQFSTKNGRLDSTRNIDPYYTWWSSYPFKLKPLHSETLRLIVWYRFFSLVPSVLGCIHLCMFPNSGLHLLKDKWTCALMAQTSAEI